MTDCEGLPIQVLWDTEGCCMFLLHNYLKTLMRERYLCTTEFAERKWHPWILNILISKQKKKKCIPRILMNKWHCLTFSEKVVVIIVIGHWHEVIIWMLRIWVFWLLVFDQCLINHSVFRNKIYEQPTKYYLLWSECLSLSKIPMLKS